jgi:hypothetical protein
MKGIISTLKVGGLRAEAFGEKNSAFATVCKNAKIYKGALAGYAPFIVPFPDIYLDGALLDVAIDWPFPQIFQTDTGIYVGTRAGMHSVALVAGVWTATLLSTGSGGGLKWPWTLADCPMFPVFASGNCLVYYDYDSTSWVTWIK